MNSAWERAADGDLRAALKRFERLLETSTLEADYQRLFAEFPFILSRSLPVRVREADIRPLARVGKSDPDFIIFPERARIGDYYGVVELKRPSSRILAEPRRGVLTLSRDATTAVAQAQVYASRLGKELTTRDEQLLFLGNRQVLFVIMGLSKELAARVASELYSDQLRGLLPSNCRLIPYDTLLQTFASTVPPAFVMLAPTMPSFVPLAQLVTMVEASLRDRDLLFVSRRSLEFWEAVESNAIANGARQNSRLIDRRRYAIPGTDHFASESDNYYDFRASVAKLVRVISGLAEQAGVSRDRDLDWFERGTYNVRHSGHALNDRQRHLLRQALQERLAGEMTPFFQIGAPDVEDLRQKGLIKLALVDSGESYYYLHPFVEDIL